MINLVVGLFQFSLTLLIAVIYYCNFRWGGDFIKKYTFITLTLLAVVLILILVWNWQYLSTY